MLASYELNDDELIEKVASKDKQALKHLFVRYHDRVFKFVLRYLKDEAVSEEIANEVFLKLWQSANSFEGRSTVSTWLLTMARNSAVSHLRKRREFLLDEGYAESLADEADNPSDSMLKSDKAQRIKNCLNDLSHQHREIIELVYYHEKSIKEVAAILEIPGNTVKTRMFYARKRLSEIAREQGLERGWP